MAQVKFKIGNLTNLASLSKAEGQFIVAKDAAGKRAEIYVDIGTGANDRLRVGDFETYATLQALNDAYPPESGTIPSSSKMYYIQENNVLAVYDSVQSQFVQVNGAGVTNVVASGSGDYITGFSYNAATGVLTLTEGTLEATDVAYGNSTVGAALDTLNGSDSTAGSVAKAVKDAVEGLDVNEFALTSVSSNVVTIKGIKEVDGKIAIGDGAGISLEEVAYTGAAADVSVADAGGLLTATNVEDALAELAQASSAGSASKTVYITETSGGSGDAFSKRYGIYQGSTGSAASPVVGEKLTDIDIPKDMVVESGRVVEVEFVEGTGGAADKLVAPIGTAGADVDVTAEIKGTGVTPTAADAGAYILLTIANASSSHLWIKATDLVDIYTSGSDPATDEVVIAISNNQITASVGSVGIASAKVNYAIPDKYEADLNVNASNYATKVADGLYYKSGNSYVQITDEAYDGDTTYYYKIDAHNETVQAALTRIDAAIGGGGSVDQKIAAAIDALDATVSQTAGNDGLALSVTEVDGKLTAVSGSIAANTYEAYGAIDTKIATLDADLDASGTAQHSGTFVVSGVTEVDGVLTAVDSVEVEAAGAAATAKSEVIGTSSDAASANTIYGAKAYADSAAGAAITWGTF